MPLVVREGRIPKSISHSLIQAMDLFPFLCIQQTDSCSRARPGTYFHVEDAGIFSNTEALVLVTRSCMLRVRQLSHCPQTQSSKPSCYLYTYWYTYLPACRRVGFSRAYFAHPSDECQPVNEPRGYDTVPGVVDKCKQLQPDAPPVAWPCLSTHSRSKRSFALHQQCTITCLA